MPARVALRAFRVGFMVSWFENWRVDASKSFFLVSISLNFFPMVCTLCGLLVWGLLIVFSLFRSFCVDFVVQGFVRTVMGVLPV